MAILRSNGILMVDAIPTHTPSGNEARIAQLINTSTRWYYNGSSWILETGGGGQPFYYEATKAQVDTLISTDALEPGAMYKITDRGDRGIFLTAISENQLSNEGTRIMLVPNTYENGAVIATRTWHSIWRTTITPSIGDKVIWNAHVWTNLTGVVGTEPDGDAVNWVLVPKTSFTEQEYVEKVFDITYDYENDWISQQRDEYNNIIGISEFENYTWNNGVLTNDYIDTTDWAYSDHLPVDGFGQLMASNKAPGPIKNNININGALTYIIENTITYGAIANNQVSSISTNIAARIEDNVGINTSTQISNNIISNIANNTIGVISGNKGVNDITYNTCFGISNNVGVYSISSNNLPTNKSITNNQTLAINSNTCNGNIENNIVFYSINQNDNSGDIYANTCFLIDQNTSNVLNIRYNVIPGSIILNENTGNISYNTNTGNIESNGNTSHINYNANLGNIVSNTNSGQIDHNNNTGNISSNTNTGTISYNSNLGDISENSNNNSITSNSNAGIISSNSNTGIIYQNTNAGNISSNTNGGNIDKNQNNGQIAVNANTSHIHYNTNNGNVINATALDSVIQDTVVNKP